MRRVMYLNWQWSMHDRCLLIVKDAELELCKDDNEQLMTQYEREKHLRKSSEQVWFAGISKLFLSGMLNSIYFQIRSLIREIQILFEVWIQCQVGRRMYGR